MTSINEIYQKYITKLNNNDFIYKVKSAYYLLTEREKKLYEVGFKDGYQLAEKNITRTINRPQQNLKKIIEKNNNLYEAMLDKTTQSLEKIISNTESLSKIQ